jgi:hypothetical protein
MLTGKMSTMRRIGAPVAVTVRRDRPVAFLWCGRRYRVSVLGTWDHWYAKRTDWRAVTRDHHVFDLYQEARTGAWVLDIAYDWYTRRPVPAIARVDIFEWDPGETTPSLLGTVRMLPNGHLEYDPPGDEGIEELVEEELRWDDAFGRERRPLTNAELLAHLPLRSMGYTWAEAYNAHGDPVDCRGVRP